MAKFAAPPLRSPVNKAGLLQRPWPSWFSDLYRSLSRATRTGTTADRPTLSAGESDIGTLYFDTTLHANGQPIWWTGTEWVDSTGASV